VSVSVHGLFNFSFVKSEFYPSEGLLLIESAEDWMGKRKYYGKRFKWDGIAGLSYNIASGNFIWKFWGLSSQSVFYRTFYLTAITISIGIAFLYLGTTLTSDTPSDFLKKNLAFLVGSPFTVFWVIFAFMRIEFGKKYEHLSRIHDALADREYASSDHIVSDNHVDTVVTNWAEDTLLYDLQNHESFQPSFERSLAAIVYTIDNMSDSEIQYFQRCYPRISEVLDVLSVLVITELKSLIADRTRSLQDRRSGGNRLTEIISLYRNAHLESPLSQSTIEKLQNIRDSEIKEAIDNVVRLRKPS